MDTARPGSGSNTLPRKIHCVGGYYAFDSDQKTPNTQLAMFEWEDGTILQFEVRGLYTNTEHGVRTGNRFLGSEGWFHLDVSGFRTYLEPGPSVDAVVVSQLAGIGGPQGFRESHFHTSSRILHRENFIKAVRSRNPADPERGHPGVSPVLRSLPPGQHFVPAGPGARFRRPQRAIRRRGTSGRLPEALE